MHNAAALIESSQVKHCGSLPFMSGCTGPQTALPLPPDPFPSASPPSAPSPPLHTFVSLLTRTWSRLP